MKIFVSPYFQKKYEKLVKKNPQLAVLIDQKFALFNKNPNHPSIRLHKLSGKTINQWSISIKVNLRIIFQFIKDGILITDIGSHKQVY